MDNLAMIAQFDWTTYEKEVAPVRNHNEAVYGRLVRKQGEPVDYKDMHFDFPSAKPVKYFSEITILRSSAIQGYFQHVPTEPVGT
jgi:transketolase C-terminal domain/subunit